MDLNGELTATMSFVREHDGDLTVDVYVQPGAKNSRLHGVFNGRPKIQVASPPVDGKANKELCRFVAKRLGVSKSQVLVDTGSSSRYKRLRIQGSDLATIRSALQDAGEAQ